MAVIPGKKNFKVDRRADFPIKLTFKDSTGSAINLTGYTVAAQVYDESRSTKYADWTVAYTNRSGGIVDISLSDVRPLRGHEADRARVHLRSPHLAFQTYPLQA